VKEGRKVTAIQVEKRQEHVLSN